MTRAVAIVAIIAIMTIELFALSQGIDGLILGGGLTIIGGLGGYTASKIIKKS